MRRLRSSRSGSRLRRVVAALLAVAPLLGADPASAANLVPINGSGSSWAQPAIQQWSKDVSANGLEINYNGNGSAQGRAQYIGQQVDFADSDIAFLTQGDPFGLGFEHPIESYSYIPIVAGGTTFMYNLVVNGQKVTNLRLSGLTLARMFTGQITNWDDPAITHDYGAQLPNEPITIVSRSDGSGASYMFTQWIATVFPSLWHSFCTAQGGAAPCGPTEFYPGFGGSIQKDGSDQVASFLAEPVSQGAIGYDEYAYALNYGLPVVKMLNAAGYYTLPTASNVAIALQAAIINPDPHSVNYLMQDLHLVYGFNDPRAYPLSSYSYLIVPRDSSNTGLPVPSRFNNDKGDTLSTWLNYVLCGAQQSAGNLGYSPLPKNLVAGGFAQDDHIPGHVSHPNVNNLDGCNNPTYSDGVNHLINDAPQPSPCDKAGAPLDCTTNGGGGGGGSGGGGGGGSGGAGTGGGSGSGTTGGVGGVVGPSSSAKARASSSASSSYGAGFGGSGSSSGSGLTQLAAAEPVSVAAKPYGLTWQATSTVLEVLAACGTPVLVGYGIRRRRQRQPLRGWWQGRGMR